MSTLKEKLKPILIDEDGDITPHNLPDHVSNWPKIDDEELDTENFEILYLTHDELCIACGGDWQEPQTVTIGLSDGGLIVKSAVDGYAEGMSYDELIEVLS